MPSRPPIPPSELWTLAWEQAAATNPRIGSDAEEEAFWQDLAPAYDVKSPLAEHSGALLADIVPLLAKGDTLLEVGPGTGAFTRRLAPYVGRIAAVEPSSAMRSVLLDGWNSSTPLEVVTRKWEDCPDLRADVLFSANAVYRVRDMVACLRRMQQAARRHVILVQTIGKPYAAPLTVSIDGEHVERERAHAIADILGELGIAYRSRTYTVNRGFGPIHDVALIDWSPAG